MELSEVSSAVEFARAPVPEIDIVPVNATVLVIEDPTNYDTITRWPVEKADGTSTFIHMLKSFDGKARIPRARRAKIVAIPPGPIAVPRFCFYRFEQEWSVLGQMMVKKAVNERWTELTPTTLKAGDIVWYVSTLVARHTVVSNGVEMYMVGVHQIDFIESEDPGIALSRVDYRLTPK